MRKFYYSILFAIGLIGITSCSQDSFEIENEVNNQDSESRALLHSDSLSADSTITPLIVNPDSIRKRTKTRTNYNSNLSDNFWAIRELPFTIQSREGGASRNNFLQTNGKSEEITLSTKNRTPTNQQKFFVKVLPAISGIPYLIYSYTENTPLSVGQRANNPDNKVLFTLPDASGTPYGADWDIYNSTNYPGYLVVESQSYTGQGSSGDWMDIFHYVWETKGDNPVGFGQYQSKNTQEFRITPVDDFTIKEIKYVNEYSANVTRRSNYGITRSYTNTQYSRKDYSMPFEETKTINSSFKENKGINFTFTNPTQKFRRPSVTQGDIQLLPSDNAPEDALYSSSYSLSDTLSVVLPLSIPPRSRMEVTYYFRVYDVTVDYEATIQYAHRAGIRETRLTGTWQGTIYVDELPISEHTYKTTNIDSGEVVNVKVDNNSKKSNRIIL